MGTPIRPFPELTELYNEKPHANAKVGIEASRTHKPITQIQNRRAVNGPASKGANNNPALGQPTTHHRKCHDEQGNSRQGTPKYPGATAQRQSSENRILLHRAQHGHKDKRKDQGWKGGWIRDLTSEGIEPNPGPAKLCNNCGKAGHLKKDCKGKTKAGGGAPGQKAATKALANSVANMNAEAQAKHDVAKEKAKDKKEEKKFPLAPKARFFEGMPFEFIVEDKMELPLSWVRLAFILKLLPFIVAFFVADLIFWPLICGSVAWIVSVLFSVWYAPFVFSFLFWIENVAVGAVAYSVKVLYSMFIGSIICKKKVYLRYADRPGKEIQEEDRRPLDSTFGDRSYVMDLCHYDVDELYFISFPYWNVIIPVGKHNIVYDRLVSGAAIALFGANVSSNRTEKEFADSIRRLLSKCSKIDWDAETMVKHGVLEGTCKYLELLKRKTDQESNRVELELKGSDEPLFGKPWWMDTWLGKLFIAVLVVSILTFGPYLLYNMAHYLICALTTVFVSIVWVVESVVQAGHSTHSFVAESVVQPVGMYGYRATDFVMRTVSINSVDPGKMLNFTSVWGQMFTDRNIMAVFSPFAIFGVAMPVADRNDTATTMAGLIHRGAGLTPTSDPDWTRAKKQIVQEICESHFLPLNDSDLLSFDKMLEATSYTKDRKEAIHRLHANRTEDFGRLGMKNRETGMFNKEEPMAEYKHARSIHAMGKKLLETDVWGSLGRFVHTVQHHVYELPPSIKKLNPKQIVDKLLTLGPGNKTVSDYSSYEASFKRGVQESAQFALYDYMAQNLSGYASRIKRHYRWVLGGTNAVKNKFFNAEIKNLKCSGDFDTALSNWFDNVATWATVFHTKHGVHWTDSINWFLAEGDDNITDDHGYEFTPEDFAKLGMKAKISTQLELNEAGFCQKYVNPETKNLVGDVIAFLGKRQYLPTKYQNANLSTKLSLARATAMSTLATYPNAPGISEWAWRVLELTASVTVRQSHLHEQQMKHGFTHVTLPTKFVEPEIILSDRIMVSEVFGFTLGQQEELTTALQSWAGGNLLLPVGWFPEVWRDFYLSFNSSISRVPEIFEHTPTWKRILEMTGAEKLLE